MFKQSLSENELINYVTKQLNFHFPDHMVSADRLAPCVHRALQRIEHCFSKINIKYYFDGNCLTFNHLNTDQYAIFLYYLSNTIWREDNDDKLASKVYYLNKALNCLDAFYEVNLPDIFILVHPLGAVLGRGEYQDYFVAYQGATVGSNKNQEYPKIGKGVAMYGGSALIGNCKISDNCLISAGTMVMDKDVPPDMVVFGRYPDISYKKTKKSVIERYFLD